ncbi:unnamed protein product [Meganyctiphanes norvegica]|uniref:Uncharacterized protein n=1 Tax=Meganyctiphanes norvegica TaxID=48144 RepID=A0AAV2S6H4_MEGNR
MESYGTSILLVALFGIILVCAILHITFKKCKRLYRKYYPESTNRKKDPGDKESASALLSRDGTPLIPLEVAALNQSPLLLWDPISYSEMNLHTILINSNTTTHKPHPFATETKRVRFAEEEATYILSTEIKREGRFLVATSSWKVDDSTSKGANKPKLSSPPLSKRRASVPENVEALLTADPEVSKDDTVIMYRKPLIEPGRRASIL